MNRRAVLAGSVLIGGSVTGGVLWRRTRSNVAIEVQNLTDERTQVSLSVSAGSGETVYTDRFDVGAGGSITRYNVAGTGEHAATIHVGDREHTHTLDSVVCHEPRIVFEIEGGLSIASFSTC